MQSTLQRRADLIPNLVNTVKGYAPHEEKMFRTKSTEARSKMGSINVGDAVNDPERDENSLPQHQAELSSALSRLIAVSERYPTLKANQGFLDLQSQLEGTENRINVARENYNEQARGLQHASERLLRRIVANPLRLQTGRILRSGPGVAEGPGSEILIGCAP